MKKLINIIFSGCLIVVITHCSTSTLNPAEQILMNGTIYSIDEQNSTYNWIAVSGDSIVGVGLESTYDEFLGENTQVIDLKGYTVFPGFIEGHAHIMGVGENLLNVDLMNTTSYEEVVAMVAERAAETPEGQWILGRGWHQDRWENDPEGMFQGFPSHDLLSEAVPNHPVFLRHASGHAALANAKAMELAGVDANTPNPGGGEVFKSVGGPTGLFNETAMGLVNKVVPNNTKERNTEALKMAIQACLQNGLTGFHQAGSGRTHVDLYKEFAARDELGIRLYVMLSGRDEDILQEYFANGIEVDPLNRLTIRSVKLYSDGALGSRGAWLLEEYSDAPGIFGHNVTPMENIEQVTLAAAAAGFQVCTHAIGDRGNRETLDIYEKAIQQFPEQMSDHRFRVEHAQHIDGDDIPRFKELNVIPAMQAIHMSSDRPWAIQRLGRRRIEEGAYVWQTLLQQGTPIVNGTDAPVEPINPFASIYASVSRKTLKGEPEGGYEPSQKMTRLQAIRSYTLDAAYGAFEEDIKGSIEVGKLADFTVVDRDLMEIPENEIIGTQVRMTMVGGKILYQAMN